MDRKSTGHLINTHFLFMRRSGRDCVMSMRHFKTILISYDIKWHYAYVFNHQRCNVFVLFWFSVG